jgi:hypothetical protein
MKIENLDKQQVAGLQAVNHAHERTNHLLGCGGLERNNSERLQECRHAGTSLHIRTYLLKVGAGEVDATVLDINEAILLQLGQHLINVLGVPCRACRHQVLRYIRVCCYLT